MSVKSVLIEKLKQNKLYTFTEILSDEENVVNLNVNNFFVNSAHAVIHAAFITAGGTYTYNLDDTDNPSTVSIGLTDFKISEKLTLCGIDIYNTYDVGNVGVNISVGLPDDDIDTNEIYISKRLPMVVLSIKLPNKLNVNEITEDLVSKIIGAINAHRFALFNNVFFDFSERGVEYGGHYKLPSAKNWVDSMFAVSHLANVSLSIPYMYFDENSGFNLFAFSLKLTSLSPKRLKDALSILEQVYNANHKVNTLATRVIHLSKQVARVEFIFDYKSSNITELSLNHLTGYIKTLLEDFEATLYRDYGLAATTRGHELENTRLFMHEAGVCLTNDLIIPD